MTRTLPDPDADSLPIDPEETTVYVLGDGPLGAAVAARLRALGREAVRLDDREFAAATDGPDADATVVVATSSDARNLLLAQLLRPRFGVEHVVVVTHRPDRVELVADAGHEAVCATDLLSEALAARL